MVDVQGRGEVPGSGWVDLGDGDGEDAKGEVGARLETEVESRVEEVVVQRVLDPTPPCSVRSPTSRESTGQRET